jgi:hypothetical protein
VGGGGRGRQSPAGMRIAPIVAVVAVAVAAAAAAAEAIAVIATAGKRQRWMRLDGTALRVARAHEARKDSGAR